MSCFRVCLNDETKIVVLTTKKDKGRNKKKVVQGKEKRGENRTQSKNLRNQKEEKNASDEI